MEQLWSIKKVDARFTELKELARAGEPLPEESLQSEADVEAYDTVAGIFRDLHFRRMSKTELQARGNLARARYIEKKRRELLNECIYKRHQEAYKKTGQLSARLAKWTDADGDGAAMLDVLQEYIHAMSGEDQPVTARKICDALRRVLLRSQASPEGTPKKAAPRFKAPTIEEVREYWKEKGLKGDPGAFFDHYEAQGWKRGRGVQIKDWKAAARSWSARESEFQKPGQSVYSSDASYDLEEYRRSSVSLRGFRQTKEETA